MSKQTITCISCPIGCKLDVLSEGGRVVSVSGNKCKRGIVYAEHEAVRPVRMLTTSVYIKEKEIMLPVRSDKPLLKEKIFYCVDKIKQLSVKLPVKTGDILIENIVDDVNIIATDELVA